MFDPYHKWLGIPKGQRPPTYYQLLGISADEVDRDVIETATLRQTAFVRNFQSGQHAKECAQVLSELALARLTLLDEAKRRAYDAKLADRVPNPVSSTSNPSTPGHALHAPPAAAVNETRTFEILADALVPAPPKSTATASGVNVSLGDGDPNHSADAPRRAKSISKPPIIVIAAALAAIVIVPTAIILSQRLTKTNSSTSTLTTSSRLPRTEARDVAIASPSLKTRKKVEGAASAKNPLSTSTAKNEALKKETEKRDDLKPGVIEVSTEPSNARLVVQGTGMVPNEIGTSADKLRRRLEFRRADGYQQTKLRFELEGYQPFVREIAPKPGEVIQIVVKLDPIPQPPPQPAAVAVAEPPKTVEIETIVPEDTLPTVRGESIKFVGHEERPTAVAFGLGGTRVLSAAEDRSVRYWETKTGKDLHVFKGFAENVTDVVFWRVDAGHYFMLTASRDGFVRLHDLKSKRQLGRFEAKQARPVTALAIAPDDRNLVSIDQNGFHDWELKPPFKEQRSGKPDDSTEFTVASFAPDGASIAIGDANGTIHVYKRDTTKEIALVETPGPASAITGLAWVDDDRFVACRRDGAIFFCSQKQARSIRKISIPGGRAYDVAVSPNGFRMITGHENPNFALVLWDVSTGRPIKRFQGHQGGVTCVAFSPDGKWILSGGEDHSLRLWNPDADPAR